MASCKDLLKLNTFKNIHLIAGKNGLYKNISWPYICHSIDFHKWINGQEVLFLTGVGMCLNEEELEKIVYKCKYKSVSALIILTNSEFIPCIPLRISDLCSELNLPLFEMPWDLKILDVSKEISNFIMNENFNINIQKELLKELLYSATLDKDKIDTLSNTCSIAICRYYFCTVLNKCKSVVQNLDYIINKIINNIATHNDTFIWDIISDKIIIVIGINSHSEYISIKQYIKNIFEEIDLYKNFKLLFGDLYNDLYSIRESYNDTVKASDLYEYNYWNYNMIDYSNLGFYKILFDINSIKTLNAYSNEILRPLIELNNKNSLNLLYTLRCYLINNCNLLKTSSELFIHRNTLIYRLNKIKDILGDNLEDAMYKNDLLNAIMIKDYLNYVYNKNKKLKHFKEETNDFNG